MIRYDADTQGRHIRQTSYTAHLYLHGTRFDMMRLEISRYHTHTHTHTHTLSLSLSLSLSHTHTHTHTYTCIRTRTHARTHLFGAAPHVVLRLSTLLARRSSRFCFCFSCQYIALDTAAGTAPGSRHVLPGAAPGELCVCAHTAMDCTRTSLYLYILQQVNYVFQINHPSCNKYVFQQQVCIPNKSPA